MLWAVGPNDISQAAVAAQPILKSLLQPIYTSAQRSLFQ